MGAGLGHVTFGRSSLTFVIEPSAWGHSSVSLGRWPLDFSLGPLAFPWRLLSFGLWAPAFDTCATAFDVRPKGLKPRVGSASYGVGIRFRIVVEGGGVCVAVSGGIGVGATAVGFGTD